MKKYSLIEAIAAIQERTGHNVTMIEFEDGSGRCFNYRAYGHKEAKFIRL